MTKTRDTADIVTDAAATYLTQSSASSTYVNTSGGSTITNSTSASVGLSVLGASNQSATLLSVRGSASATTVLGIDSEIGASQLNVIRTATDTAAPAIQFLKRRGTRSAPTTVVDTDQIGDIYFNVYDGAATRNSALIRGTVDGAVGSSDTPGRLEFYTSADGTSTLTERMRIDNAGLITGSGISLGAWTTWTPALTASTTNPTLGTGSTATGRYARIGRIVVAEFQITFGTSGVNAGSGDYRISLPVNTATTNNLLSRGSIWMYDNSTAAAKMGACFMSASTYFIIRGHDLIIATNAAPWTWAAQDSIAGSLFYEAAS